MFKVLEVPLQTNLDAFSRLLWQHRISHRIFPVEEAGLQVIAVAKAEQVVTTGQLYGQWQRGEIQPGTDDSAALGGYVKTGEIAGTMLGALKLAPLTMLLIAASCLLLWLAPLEHPTALTLDLMYPDFSYGTRQIVLSRVLENFNLQVFLTMLTPILLHGGLLHLAFNMMWLWELGRLVELRQSSLILALTIIFLALVSNTVQYLWGGGNNFGGMSGVVYGLFGYIWMWQLFDPGRGIGLPGNLIFFMLLSLVIMTLLELEMIANAAHLGGFFAGVLLGAVSGTVSRVKRAYAVPTKGE